jgi:hypothetical protein
MHLLWLNPSSTLTAAGVTRHVESGDASFAGAMRQMLGQALRVGVEGSGTEKNHAKGRTAGTLSLSL